MSFPTPLRGGSRRIQSTFSPCSMSCFSAARTSAIRKRAEIPACSSVLFCPTDALPISFNAGNGSAAEPKRNRKISHAAVEIKDGFAAQIFRKGSSKIADQANQLLILTRINLGKTASGPRQSTAFFFTKPNVLGQRICLRRKILESFPRSPPDLVNTRACGKGLECCGWWLLLFTSENESDFSVSR